MARAGAPRPRATVVALCASTTPPTFNAGTGPCGAQSKIDGGVSLAFLKLCVTYSTASVRQFNVQRGRQAALERQYTSIW